MNRRRQPLSSTVILLALSLGACTAGEEGGEDEEVCAEGDDKCDALTVPDSAVPASPCDGVIRDMSGRGNEKVAGRLRDPLAKFALRAGSDCPVTFQAILAKLKTTDATNCENSNGLLTRAISETAQLENTPTSFRLVTSRTCAKRSNHGLLFSLFGVAGTAKTLPKNVEMIAFDATAGVFNYYETDGTTLNFFGNSKDMLKGPDGENRRCAGCHVGGGLIMKELRAPWVHWEGDTTTPGVDTLLKNNRTSLGTKSDGIELEGTVELGNNRWNKSRIAFLRKLGDTKELLRPLFWSVELNIGTAGPGDVTFIPSDIFLESRTSNFAFLEVATADYQALITANGQQVGDTGKADTFFPMAFPHRSGIDSDYVGQLVEAGIINDEFASDVLMVDFTRPIFSDERCALLEFTPSIPSDQLSPASLTAGFIANLGTPASGSPERELQRALEIRGSHTVKVQTFTDVCAARPRADLLADVLQVVSRMRDQARERQVMEFPETMPDDNLDVPAGTRLDPKTCLLTTQFVPVRAH